MSPDKALAKEASWRGWDPCLWQLWVLLFSQEGTGMLLPLQPQSLPTCNSPCSTTLPHSLLLSTARNLLPKVFCLSSPHCLLLLVPSQRCSSFPSCSLFSSLSPQPLLLCDSLTSSTPLPAHSGLAACIHSPSCCPVQHWDDHKPQSSARVGDLGLSPATLQPKAQLTLHLRSWHGGPHAKRCYAPAPPAPTLLFSHTHVASAAQLERGCVDDGQCC